MDDPHDNSFAEASSYVDSDERPPWIEEATDPTWWDLAFGSYGDGYLEWVHNRYYFDPEDLRTVADTRNLWRHRRRYMTEERLDELLDRNWEETFQASDPALLEGFVDEPPAVSRGRPSAEDSPHPPASGRFITKERKAGSSSR